MKSFEELYTEIQDQTFDTSAAGLVVIKRRINDGIKYIARHAKGVFLDKVSTLTTTASTQFTNAPFDLGKIISISVTVGTRTYAPKEITSQEQWDRLNQSSVTSDIPEYWFVKNTSTGKQIGLYPIPAGANTITVNHQKRIRDLVHANYTTGTITTLANGGTAVTGSGTTWTSKMIGRWLKITLTDTAGSGDGDGEWYQISGRSSNTAITIARGYNGTAISGGSATYIIGEISDIPEGHEDAITDYVLWKHYLRIGDRALALDYKSSLDQHIKDLRSDYFSHSENLVINDGTSQPINNPNLYLTL